MLKMRIEGYSWRKFGCKDKVLCRKHWQNLAKYFRGLEVILSYKTSHFCKVTSKISKKMKYGEIQVSSMINEQGYKFKLEDALMLHLRGGE